MLKLNQIYKVKEGHEGECDLCERNSTQYIRVKSINNKYINYEILDKNKDYVAFCDCFTEDDLEIEEEDKYIKIESVKEQNKIEAELGVFWQQISEFLPRSKEREALGDGIIFKALKQAYLLFRPILLSKENNTIEEEVKEKSLEDLEVGDEAIKRILNRIDKMKEEARVGTGWTCDGKLMTLRFDKLINEIRDITNYNSITTFSPSEAETLLEEKLGIKVKIKN